MNTDDKLLQILENSSCLSKGQMTGYLKHTLYPEELRAVELHLSSCALCNDALEGMETQVDVDKLLASMIPPVLPAAIAKEKPKEKKEVPVPVKPEKTETTIPFAKTTAQHTAEPGNKNDIHTNPFRPGRKWARPMGIAAALILAIGGFWYFKFNKDSSERQIAQHINPKPYNEPANMDSEQRTAMQTAAPHRQDSLNKIAEKKHSDSIYLAKKAEQKLKAKADSILLASKASGDSDKSIAAENQPVAAAKVAEADEKEQQPEIAMKRTAAAPEVSKQKEQSKELSDFELGMQKYKQKNFASALLYFKSAESDKGDPKHWEAVYYSGLCNKLLNKERKARKLFERVVEAGVPLKKSAQKQLDIMKKENDK